MSQSNPIRVFIVEDYAMVRRGLSTFLETYDDMLLVGEAPSGEEAISLCDQAQPNVILMDLVLPGIDGVETIRRIHENWPTIQMVALTNFKDEGLVQRALQAGAIGYLLKNVSVDELARAIRAAYKGKPTLAPEAAQALIEVATRPSTSYQLSERERQVLALLVKGLTNRQIAQRLNLSNSTVKFHVSGILSKLHVTSRTEAVSLALQERLEF